MNHDSHYRTLETKGQEPIVRMESIICRGIPEEFHEVARRNLNMALASKHEDRAGEKSGEDWHKELTKAGNYLHRAVHGRWIGQGEGVKESLTTPTVKDSLTVGGAIYFDDPQHGRMVAAPDGGPGALCKGCFYLDLDASNEEDECPCDRPDELGAGCHGHVWRKVAE